MSPEGITQAYGALQSAVADAGNQGVATIDANAAAKAPGLAPVAGYDAGRYVVPTTQALTDQLVVAGKQAALKKALGDASFVSQTAYTDANSAYQARQRQYYRDLAIVAAEKQRKADAQTAATAAATTAAAKVASGQGGGTVIIQKAAPQIAPLSVQGGNTRVQGGGLSVQGGGGNLQGGSFRLQ